MGAARKKIAKGAVGLPEHGKMLRALFDKAPNFVALTSGPDHRFEYFNAAFRRMANNRSLVGKTFAEGLPELVDQGFLNLRDQVYRTGKPVRRRAVQFSLPLPGGGEAAHHHVDFIYSPITSEDGAVTGVFLAGYDISEQKAAEEKVELLQTELIHISRASAMGTMATTLAHELNQPLTAISSYLSGSKRLLARGSAQDLERAGEALELALESARRAGEIIRGLRDMTMRGGTKRNWINLAEAIDEAVRFALVGAGEKGVVSRVELAPDLDVEADRIQIQQVMLNLIRNATEAMAKSPRRELVVDARLSGGKVLVQVSDTGPGLDRETRKTLFEPFITTKEDGMGIGLSISRTIIEAHGGQLWAEDNVNGGASFCFSLPLTRRD